MGGRLGCSPLKEFYGILACREASECIGQTAILYLAYTRGKIGRLAAAKELGLGERKARTLIEKLRARGVVERKSVGVEVASTTAKELIGSLECYEEDKHVLAVANNAERELVELAIKHYLTLRDHIVLSLGDPAALLMLFMRIGTDPPIAPGMPREYLARLLGRINALDEVWGRPSTYIAALFQLREHASPYYCSSLLYALEKLCEHVEEDERADEQQYPEPRISREHLRAVERR